MPNPREIDDTEFERLRDAGAFVCQCEHPEPTPTGWFNAMQCQRCMKPIPRDTHLRGSTR